MLSIVIDITQVKNRTDSFIELIKSSGRILWDKLSQSFCAHMILNLNFQFTFYLMPFLRLYLKQTIEIIPYQFINDYMLNVDQITSFVRFCFAVSFFKIQVFDSYLRHKPKVKVVPILTVIEN